jgi:hypothetical protein
MYTKIAIGALGLIVAAGTADSLIKGRLLVASSNTKPTCATASGTGDACVDGDLETNAQLDVNGAATLRSTLGVTGLTTTTGGLTSGAVNAVTGVDSLTSADCGKITTVTEGIDTATITLPEASTVIGCTFHIMYIGTDAGALLDISPLDSDADGIEGSCKAANGTTVTFSGTADADIGLTKATIVTGDVINLTAVGAAMWVAWGISGVCANN